MIRKEVRGFMGLHEGIVREVSNETYPNSEEKEGQLTRGEKIASLAIVGAYLSVAAFGSFLRFSDSSSSEHAQGVSTVPGGVYAEEQVDMFPTDVIGTPVFEVVESPVATPGSE